MFITKQNRKRILASAGAVLVLALGIFGSAAIPSLGQNGKVLGSVPVAHASDCEGPLPHPDLDILCPTPTPTPDED